MSSMYDPVRDAKKRKAEDVKEQETTEDPPKKLKKPSRRTNNEDRARQVEQTRERIERQEKGEIAQEQVRDYYNQLERRQDTRQNSPIIALRSFNNFIKSALINQHTPRRSVILDLGCGKGGDLQKWEKNGCVGWIGVDIAQESVDQAKERYENSRREPRFWADFCVGDPFTERVEDIVHPDAFPVDVVSMQFALHYAWESEDRAKTLLDNVSRALKPGGKFIGTIPNSSVILDKVQEHGKKFGNQVYKVEFEELPDDTTDFGNKYVFYLQDAIGNVPEYLVPFESLKTLAAEYDLELEYNEPFLDMFDEVIKDHHLNKLASRMKVLTHDGKEVIDKEQREACAFYRAFAFKKKKKERERAKQLSKTRLETV